MTAKKESKKLPWGQRASGWFYSALFEKGWPRRLLVAVSFIAIISAAFILWRGSNFNDNPAYLVPPSVSTYMETSDVDALLRGVGSWRLWSDKRRERENQLHVDIAVLLGNKVSGLGTSLPLRWLSGASRAAYCATRDAENGSETWALYLKMDDPAAIMSEIVVEPGMQWEVLQERDDRGIYSLSDSRGGRLVFAVIAPWLIISSQETLPQFALSSKPSITLASSDVLLHFKGAPSLRGMIDPSHSPVELRFAHAGNFSLSAWTEPQSRIVFSSSFGKQGGVDTSFSSVILKGKPGGGGFWPFLRLLRVLLGLVGVVCVAVVFLNIIRLGGWLKVRAARLGIAPAHAPTPVEPSSAFREDVGLVASQPVHAGKIDKLSDNTTATAGSPVDEKPSLHENAPNAVHSRLNDADAFDGTAMSQTDNSHVSGAVPSESEEGNTEKAFNSHPDTDKLDPPSSHDADE